MKNRNVLLRGTLLLTFAGIFSRIMGFFYRIFLANSIGAEGMGIYQMIFPIYSVCISFCASGIETAVSKLTAAKYAAGKSKEASDVLKAGLFLTITLSLLCSFFVYQAAPFLSDSYLKEPRCLELLKVLAIVFPFSAIHCCLCGYYFGVHKAGVPSWTQLIEQLFRIGSTLFLCHMYLINEIPISPLIAVMGLVFGEFCGFLFITTCYSFRLVKKQLFRFRDLFHPLREISALAVPLSAGRVSLNLLAGLEAVIIPNALTAYGMTLSDALSVYGILNGMALPFLLFPNALTNSLSTMLLPEVSECAEQGNLYELQNVIRKTFSFCLILGVGCLLFFLLSGKFLGTFFFSSELAGDFMTVLSWICPFLYLNTTLNSVLNGLGKTDVTFFNGILGIFIRIAFIFFVVPKIGIHGYLYGLLASQLFTTGIGFIVLYRKLSSKSTFLSH